MTFACQLRCHYYRAPCVCDELRVNGAPSADSCIQFRLVLKSLSNLRGRFGWAVFNYGLRDRGAGAGCRGQASARMHFSS